MKSRFSQRDSSPSQKWRDDNAEMPLVQCKQMAYVWIFIFIFLDMVIFVFLLVGPLPNFNKGCSF